MVGWLLLVYFPFTTFSIAIDTADECAALVKLTVVHAQERSVAPPPMVCAETIRV